MKIKNKSKLFGLIGRGIFQILFFFNKISVKGEEHLFSLIKSGKPVMLCVWHGRLLFPSWYIRFYTTLHIISSRHPDSEILAHILRYWGYDLIRGSTDEGGMGVIKEMTKIFKKGGMVAITNDGPKGPPRIAKSGSISLAIKNNVQMFTVTGSATKYWQMKSWDKFMLPKPFGKIQIVISPPIDIKEKPTNAAEEVQVLSEFINKYQDEADRIIGKIS